MYNMCETLLQCKKLATACYMLLRATVYESDLSPEARSALRVLFDVRNNDDEYNTMLVHSCTCSGLRSCYMPLWRRH